MHRHSCELQLRRDEDLGYPENTDISTELFSHRARETDYLAPIYTDNEIIPRL